MFLSLLLSLTGAHAVEYTDISKLDYAVYFEPVVAQVGNYVDIVLKEKTQMLSGGYGIDLVMPEGFSVVKQTNVFPSDVLVNDGSVIASQGDNRYRINYILKKNVGLVPAHSDVATLRVRLKIEGSVAAGVYAIRITNSEIVSENGEAGSMKRPDDIYCKINLQNGPVVTETTTSIDLRDFDENFGMVDVSANPNVLIYANEGQVDNENNVIVDGNCESLILKDKYPFAVDEEFHVDYACYEREDITGLSTLYLPFSFKPTSFNAYVLDSESGGVLNFKARTTSCSAFTPLVICPKDGEASATVKIEKEDFDIVSTSEKSVKKNSYSFTGVLSTRVLRGGDLCYVFSATDHKFKRCNDAGTIIRSFRCYVQGMEDALSKSNIEMFIENETTGVNTIASDIHETIVIHDLLGRRITVPKVNDIYIVNGKKVIFE